MKKVIFTLSISTFMLGTILMGCQSSTKKEEVAQEKFQDAKENLEQVQYDANLSAQKKAAIAEEWNKFRNDTRATITENEIQIAELKVKIKKSGNRIDSIYYKKIDLLEQKNKDIEAKIKTYKNDTNSDWESFKREYNHDMNELGKALKDMTIDNKK